MLVVTRKTSESLMIGDDVEVTILGVRGNQVRVGVKAPKKVGVYRRELYDRIQAEEEQE